jgi:hypothetical protein
MGTVSVLAMSAKFSTLGDMGGFLKRVSEQSAWMFAYKFFKQSLLPVEATETACNYVGTEVADGYILPVTNDCFLACNLITCSSAPCQ